jgi:hypothetical protein
MNRIRDQVCVCVCVLMSVCVCMRVVCAGGEPCPECLKERDRVTRPTYTYDKLPPHPAAGTVVYITDSKTETVGEIIQGKGVVLFFVLFLCLCLCMCLYVSVCVFEGPNNAIVRRCRVQSILSADGSLLHARAHTHTHTHTHTHILPV